jgi:tetratricopeptide (TPR) repeat protein
MLALWNSSVGWKSVLLGAAILCSGGVVTLAQNPQQTPPDAPAQTPPPAKPPANASATKPAAKQPSDTSAAAPASADDNAFPEAQSEAAQKKAQAAQDNADSSDSNAFPEAKSEAAQKQAEGNGSVPPASDGKSYSSSRSKSMSLNDLLGTNDSAVSDGAGHYINNDKLAKEDIRVGRFYLAQGNYPGAYMRLKEATEVGPGNVDAVYLLAEAARKISHLDEAETNYKLYLQVEPDGKYAKDSLKALKELAGK